MNALAVFFFLLTLPVGIITNDAGSTLSCCLVGFAIICLNPKNKQA